MIAARDSAGPFYEPFTTKVNEQIDTKIDTEQVMKIDENTCEHWPLIHYFFENDFHEKSVRQKWAYENHFSPKVEYVSARVHPKRNETDELQKETIKTIGREQMMQTWKN